MNANKARVKKLLKFIDEIAYDPKTDKFTWNISEITLRDINSDEISSILKQCKKSKCLSQPYMEYNESRKKGLMRSRHTLHITKHLKYTEWLNDEWYKLDRDAANEHMIGKFITYKL